MRKFLIVTAILLIAVLMFQGNVSADAMVIVSLNSDDGIVTVIYDSEINKTIKVVIEKDTVKYTYDMLNSEERYPLQLGNGNYSLKVFEQVEGTTYNKIYETVVELKMVDTQKVFLTSNQIINFKADDKIVLVANDLTKNLTTENEKINAIYKYVVKNYKYDYNKIVTLNSNYIPDINAVEAEKKGICYDYSVILASMLRSQGIECKVIKGYSEATGATYHAWNEIYSADQQKWITVDTTVDAFYNQKHMKYTMEKESKKYTNVKEF